MRRSGETSNDAGDVPAYYGRFRSDIVENVPDDARRILSVGCASGRTEAEFVQRGVRVVGIEINPEAAERARQRGLHVLEGDVSSIDVGTEDGPYDCLIYADVLEHLTDPVGVLRRHVEHLRSGGTVIVSVPNFRHYQVFAQLFVRGYIRYSDAGVLDRTHLRITTRKMVVQWFNEVGLIPASWKYQMLGRRNKLLSACLLGMAKEFIAHIVICVGRKP
ncbi:MAG: class I SAM-dependent methyltransferase [Sedimentisphaerales bacterium]|nr:class I SAM-dependent methyltransferase [Sedimentisphaerales bacterium]